jgi:aspartokinase
MMGRDVPVEEDAVKSDGLTYVAKFGGSSIADAKRMREIYKIIEQAYLVKNDRPVIVLSAMGKSTN